MKIIPGRKGQAESVGHTSKPKADLEPALKLKIYDFMVKARALEERLIKMSKAGLGFFWIGGPGEEAFNVPLGLLIKKGEGPDYDFLHFHYRQSATLLAMGEPMIQAIRQMHNTATDPYSGGRNFVNHYAIKKWNVVNVTSPIEPQYSIAIGTAVAQRRHFERGGGDGITIVTGGDAGTAEGDFASSLVWASRQGRELPILIIVTNNWWGISTPYDEVHCASGSSPIAKRGEAFGIPSVVVKGNDVVASYFAISQAMEYVRKERRPFLLEAQLSRLYGHSSASGANWVPGEVDCIPEFEKLLTAQGLITNEECKKIREGYEHELLDTMKKVLQEPKPRHEDIFEHVFANKEDTKEPWPRWLKR